MRIGLVARGENRGLGLQTWEAFRHLNPTATLLVDMGELARGFPSFPERFPGATRVRFDGHRFSDTDLVRDWLTTVDVVYTAETAYQWAMCKWARQAGVATVVHTNPELHRTVEDRDGHEPSMWWNPTGWHMDLLTDAGWTRAPVVEVPMPVATERFRQREPADRVRFLHVLGHVASADRNGSSIVARALRRVRAGQTWTVRAQLPGVFREPANVTADLTVAGPVDNYWDLYNDADVLVMPRRYGGLCLPVQEAMAAGLAVVMSDCAPNRRWPIVPLLAERPSKLNRRGIIVHAPNFVDLVQITDRLETNPGEVDDWSARSLRWAAENSWDALLPVWVDALTNAANRI